MSRRKGTSCVPPRRITSSPSGGRGRGALLQLLGELQTVTVGVEDVDYPNLAVQLEHGSDVDACRAEPAGLGFDVIDVQDRHGRLLIRFPLGEADGGLAVGDDGPAFDCIELPRYEP